MHLVYTLLSEIVNKNIGVPLCCINYNCISQCYLWYSTYDWYSYSVLVIGLNIKNRKVWFYHFHAIDIISKAIYHNFISCYLQVWLTEMVNCADAKNIGGGWRHYLIAILAAVSFVWYIFRKIQCRKSHCQILIQSKSLLISSIICQNCSPPNNYTLMTHYTNDAL